MRDVLKDIPEDAQERRRRESGRRDGGRYQQGAGNDKGMEGYWEEASEMGDAQVSRRPREASDEGGGDCLSCLERDRGRPVGHMILCRNRLGVRRWREGRLSIGLTPQADIGRRREKTGRGINYIRNNMRCILDPERSLYNIW